MTRRIRHKLHSSTIYKLSLILLPLAMGSICANLAFVTNQIKWKMINPQNYRMNVLLVALPAPVIEIAVTVRQGKDANVNFVACEKDQTKYPIGKCETLKNDYPNLLKTDFTVIGLFEQADCNAFLKNRKGWECYVQYDSQYGYPTEIIYRDPPPVLDGTSITKVTVFQIDE